MLTQLTFSQLLAAFAVPARLDTEVSSFLTRSVGIKRVRPTQRRCCILVSTVSRCPSVILCLDRSNSGTMAYCVF